MQYQNNENTIFSMQVADIFDSVTGNAVSIRADAFKMEFDHQQPMISLMLTKISAIEAMPGDTFEQQYQAYAEQYQAQVLSSTKQQLMGNEVYQFTYKIDAEFQDKHFDIQGMCACIIVDDLYCLDFSAMYETKLVNTFQAYIDTSYNSIAIIGDRDAREHAHGVRVAEVNAMALQASPQEEVSMLDKLATYGLAEFTPPVNQQNVCKVSDLEFTIDASQSEFLIGRSSHTLVCKVVANTQMIEQGEEQELFREDNGQIIFSTDINHVYQSGDIVRQIHFEEGKTGAPWHHHLRCDGVHYGLNFTGIVECRDGWFSCRGYLSSGYSHKTDFPVEIYYSLDLTSLDWAQYRFSYAEALTASPSIVRFLRMDKPDMRTLPDAIFAYQHIEELSIYGEYDYMDPELVRSPLIEIPQGIAQLTQLKHMSIVNTSVEHLPVELGQLTQLEQLSLSNNRLQTLPESIFQLPQLKYLFVSNNGLTELPNDIALPCLINIDIDKNNLTTLPPALALQANLKNVNLEGNPWDSLPEEYNQVENIKLDISDKKRLLNYDYPGANNRGVIQWDERLFHVSEDKALSQQLCKAIDGTVLEHYQKALLHIALKSVCVTTTTKDDYSTLGHTRFGGLPDLPLGDNYPSFYSDYHEGERGYQFIAQLNCAELSSYQEYLPCRGMLYFYLVDQESFACHVIYCSSDSGLQSASVLNIQEAYIGDEGGIYEPFKAEASSMISIPHFYSDDYWFKNEAESLVDIENDDQKNDGYSEVRDDVSKKLGVKGIYREWNDHYYPDDHHAINTYVFTQHEPPQVHVAGIMKGNPEDWIVLLKVHSDNNTGFCFWDAGEISFLIHKSDLAQQDFSNVYCTLETS